MKPLAIDLFCGLGGWAEGLLAEGWDVIGFDVERHVYGEHRYPATLVLQDVLTVHGAQFRDATLIVASPPCQEFSYMAMPWSLAKAKAAAIRADTTGQMLADLTRLFDACFRIQREACEAAGRRIPMIVENVRGAQPWVGEARANYGSYFLWGDAPLPQMALPGFDTARQPLVRRGRGFKSSGMNWSDQTKRGQDFTRIAGRQAMEGRKAFHGGADGWFGDYATMKEGVKQRGSGREWFAGDGKISRMTSSDSPARKMASAMIAKIPEPLARHIAQVYHSRRTL